MGRAAPDGPVTKTVYLLEKEAKTPDERPVLKAVTVKIGITDGNYSEVLEGVKEDDVLVTGIVTPAVNPAMANAPQGRSPFGGPFGGGGGGRGPR